MVRLLPTPAASFLSCSCPGFYASALPCILCILWVSTGSCSAWHACSPPHHFTWLTYFFVSQFSCPLLQSSPDSSPARLGYLPLHKLPCFKSHGTPCWKWFLWLAFHCLYYHNHIQWLAWRTLPLCLTVKCLCLVQGEMICPSHLWTEEINTPLLKVRHFSWRCFCQTEDPFTSLPHCLSLSILPSNFSSSLLLVLSIPW